MIRRRLWESEKLENLRSRSKGLTSALSKRRDRELARKQPDSEEFGPDRKWTKTELRELDMAEHEAAKLFDILQEITDTARELKEEQGIEIKIFEPGFYSFNNSGDGDESYITIYPEEYDGFGAYYNVYEGKYCGVFHVNNGNEIDCLFLEEGRFDPSTRDGILNVLPSSGVGGKIGTFYKNIKKMFDTAAQLQDEFEAEATKKLDEYERKEVRGLKESRYSRNACLAESRRRI